MLTPRRHQKAEDVGEGSRQSAIIEGTSCFYWMLKARVGLELGLEAIFLHDSRPAAQMALHGRILIFPLGLLIYRYSMK